MERHEVANLHQLNIIVAKANDLQPVVLNISNIVIVLELIKNEMMHDSGELRRLG